MPDLTFDENQKPEFAKYLTEVYGNKLGECPKLVINNYTPNKEFMDYLRKAVCVIYNLNVDDTSFSHLEASLNGLCDKLYNDYQSPMVTLMNIAMYAKTVSETPSVDDTYTNNFGINLSEIQRALGFNPTDGFWASQTYALFSNYALYKNPEKGDNEIRALAQETNNFLATHKDFVQTNHLVFVRTDGLYDLKNYLYGVTTMFYHDMNVDFTATYDKNSMYPALTRVKKELPKLNNDNYYDWCYSMTRLLFLRGCSADYTYRWYSHLTDDIGFFDHAYYLQDGDDQQDSVDKITDETLEFLLSGEEMKNVTSLLFLKLSFERALRNKFKDNDINLDYNGRVTIDEQPLHNVFEDIKNITGIDIQFLTGENAQNTYGSDAIKNENFTEMSTKIKDGRIEQVKLDDGNEQYSSELIFDQAGQLVDAMNVNDGKFKVKMNVDIDATLAWTYYFYINRINNDPTTMPLLVTFSLKVPLAGGALTEIIAELAEKVHAVNIPDKVHELAVSANNLLKQTPDFLTNATNIKTGLIIVSLVGIILFFVVSSTGTAMLATLVGTIMTAFSSILAGLAIGVGV